MSIYYKYAPNGTKIVVLSYVDNFVYWYTPEALEKWIVDDLGKILHVKFSGYAHRLISIVTYQMKDYSISLDWYVYATSSVVKYLDTDTVKAGTKFYNTALPSDMIFTKSDTYTSDKQVEKFTSEFNIHCGG